MKRHHLFEIEDMLWFPSAFRNLITDILGFIVVRFHIYEPVVPLIRDVMQHMKTNQIIDLCSGGSGPWSQIQTQLHGQQEFVSVTLTDRYPNMRAIETINKCQNRKLQYLSESVDATNVPAHLKGIRTIFSAFHHFEPDAARKILQNTVNSRSAIGIFEFTEKRLDRIPLAFFLPLLVFLVAPFIKPRTFRNIFWSNVVPLVPLLFTYDAIISHATTYTPEDLKELIQGIPSQGYEWKIGQIPNKLRTMRITYLIGFPKDPHEA